MKGEYVEMGSSQGAQLDGLTPPSADGWIEWMGGERPVSKDTWVFVKYQDGGTEGPDPARCFDWDHVYETANIIAYRVSAGGEAVHEQVSQPIRDEPKSAPTKAPSREEVARALFNIFGVSEKWEDMEKYGQGGFEVAADQIITLFKGGRAVSEWQPIETAPKDGTVIHVWGDGYEWPEAVMYELYSLRDAKEAGADGYWRYAETLMAEVCDSAGEDEWTHWRPLPAPPLTALEAGE